MYNEYHSTYNQIKCFTLQESSLFTNIYTSRPRRKLPISWRHFQVHFLKVNIWLVIKISLKSVSVVQLIIFHHWFRKSVLRRPGAMYIWMSKSTTWSGSSYTNNMTQQTTLKTNIYADSWGYAASWFRYILQLLVQNQPALACVIVCKLTQNLLSEYHKCLITMERI